MATQIASTPTVKGSEAVRIMKEANKQPSAKTLEGAEKIKQYFEKMTKNGN